MSKIPFISRDEFLASLHYGSHYEGLVDTIGYVSWGKIYPRNDHPGFPNHRSPFFHVHTDFVGGPIYVPSVVPEREILKQVELPEKELLNACMRRNADGTITVTTFDLEEITVSGEDSRISVQVGDEPYFGQTERVVTLEIVDRKAGINISSKATLKDVIKFLGDDNMTYASFLLGAAEYRLGHHVEKMLRFRGLETVDGFPLTGRTDPYTGGARSAARGTDATKFMGMKVTTAAKVAGALKGTGATLGVFGLVYTFYQYTIGEISGERTISDLVFGAIGFAGWPGMAISTVYFIWVSPLIDQQENVHYRDVTKEDILNQFFQQDLKKLITIPIHNPQPGH